LAERSSTHILFLLIFIFVQVLLFELPEFVLELVSYLLLPIFLEIVQYFVRILPTLLCVQLSVYEEKTSVSRDCHRKSLTLLSVPVLDDVQFSRSCDLIVRGPGYRDHLVRDEHLRERLRDLIALDDLVLQRHSVRLRSGPDRHALYACDLPKRFVELFELSPLLLEVPRGLK
jgi:hypothetical protein